MSCMTAGKDNLAYNCNQNTQSHSFHFFHFLPFSCDLGAPYNLPSSARMMMITRRSPTIPPGP
jgi:hypothetical protein